MYTQLLWIVIAFVFLSAISMWLNQKRKIEAFEDASKQMNDSAWWKYSTMRGHYGQPLCGPEHCPYRTYCENRANPNCPMRSSVPLPA
jgi:hypothetical protein